MLDLFADVELISLAPDREQYVINFPYSAEKKEELKARVPGMKWIRESKSWLVPDSVDAVVAMSNLPYEWTPEARMRASTVEHRHKARVDQSRAASAELHLPGFNKEPFPFQKAGILYALDRKRVIIGDEMGLGKTIQALATLHAANAYPALIVTPASLKFNWAESEIPACIPGRHVVVAGKKTSPMLLRMADIIVTNYEQLVGTRIGPDGARTSWLDESKKEVVLSPLAEHLRELKLRFIAADEAHYIKDSKSARTAAFMALRQGVEYRLLLSGTPMLNKPQDFASLLKFIDRLDEFGGWWQFMIRYCGMQKGYFGYEAKTPQNELELNEKMRASCYVRRKKMDVLTEMPDKIRTPVILEIDNREEYDKAERELKEWVKDRVLRDKKFLESIKHLDPATQKMLIRERQEDKAEKAERGKMMVRIQALKIITANGKKKEVRDWIKNFLESGEKLVYFATHQEILEYILKAFPGCARILSIDSPEMRQANVKRFQTDPACNLIVCAQGTSATNSPGGVGHTLTAASNVLTHELGWNPALHDQCEDRCHRIGQKDTVNCWYAVGRSTIDFDILEIIEDKRKLSRQVVDGDDSEVEDGILSALERKLAE
ncbi:MAG: DEAD/DEAH box helicase [Candidatus Obscuribacterales bacterium]|nr:DEAD/DEAH box helicase [Candidatus Obscuribacterales bacterium]